MRRFGALALCIFASTAWPGPVAADRGVSISLGSIAVSEALQAGREYRLPQLSVLNPGDERSAYVMDAVPLANEAVASLDPAWLSFAPASFTLEPGARRDVTVVLRVPSEAAAGPYLGMIRAVLATGDATGAVLGAAAGSRLTFTVEAPAASILRSITGAWTGAGPWSWALAAVLAGVALALILRRRFSLRIERRQ
jgi:hypothetical protein